MCVCVCVCVCEKFVMKSDGMKIDMNFVEKMYQVKNVLSMCVCVCVCVCVNFFNEI